MRAAVTAAVAFLSLTSLSVAADVQAAIKKNISIPAGGLVPALRTLSKERHVHIVFISEDVHKLSTEGASGALSVNEALERILKGTGLTYQYIDAETVSILPSTGAGGPGQRPAGTDERAERSQEFEEIVVTARRRTESAQDVPVAVTVLSNEQVAVPGSVGLTQVAQLAPSLQITAMNPRQTNINIRGLGATPAFATLGLEYGVGVYVDQVYYSRPAQTAFDLYDLQQVEVLRGPQGTLFGKNTTAGAIHITSRAPSFDPEFHGEVSWGDYRSRQMRATGSVPIGDKVAVRLTVSDTERDKGFLQNVHDGSRLADLHTRSIRGQLLFKPIETFSLRLIADDSKYEQDCCIGTVATVRTTLVDGSTLPNNLYVRAARFGYTLPAIDPFNLKLDLNRPTKLDVKTHGVTAIADYDVGSATITSVTAWRSLEYLPTMDADLLPLDIFVDAGIHEKQRQSSQELRIASNGGNTVDYVAGLYYFDQRIDNKIKTKFGPDAALWIIGPAPGSSQASVAGQAALNGLFTDGTAQADTKSYAVFSQLVWHATDSFDVAAGLRYTSEEKSGFFDQAQRGPELTPEEIALGAQTIRNNFSRNIQRYAAKAKEDNVSGSLTLSYKVTPDVMVYGSYAKGYKSGGLNLNATGAPPVIDPEKVDNFELGIKTTLFDRVLTLNIAAFDTRISNYQSQQTVLGGTLVSYIANAGTVRSQGVELDAVIRPVRNLSLFASGSYIDAIYDDYQSAPCPLEYLNVRPSCDLSGQNLPGVSKHSLSLGGDYTVDLRAGMLAYLSTNYSYRSKSNSTYNLSEDTAIKGYGLTNLRIGLRGLDGRWDVSLYARNLFDKEYFNIMAPGAFNTGLYTGIPNDPRTYGLTLRTSL